MSSRPAAERRGELIELLREMREEHACPLAATRTKLVFGAGNADADLMFAGEAPGFHEDQQGLPFVGRAGQFLDELLAGIGLARSEVFICNVLKCRPPGNRDPLPSEIEICKPFLFRQIELIEPRVICTLGNFATKCLSGRPDGITRCHGQPLLRELGGRWVHLFPVFHPAAALRTPAMAETMRHDFARLPALLREPLPESAGPVPKPEEPADHCPPDADPDVEPEAAPQLDLF
jgi:DNA polymerase